MIPTRNIRIRKRSNGMRGADFRQSRAINATPAKVPIAIEVSPTSTPPLPQVSVPQITAANMIAFNSALFQSNGRSTRGICGSASDATIIVAIPIGTLTPNSQGHEAIERIAAAKLGPSAEDTAMIMAFMPKARPSLLGG